MQVGQTNYINQNNYVVLDENEEDAEFDELETHYDFFVNQRNNGEGREAPPNTRGTVQMDTRQANEEQPQATQRRTPRVRILNGNQLLHLGEGTIYFWTTAALSNSFQAFKDGLRNAHQIELEQHREEEYVLTFHGSTPERTHYTQREVEIIKRNVQRETTYDNYLKLDGVLSESQLVLVKQTYQISDSTKYRIKDRSIKGEALTGKKRGRKEGMNLKITDETIMWIKRKVDQNPCITLIALKKQLNKAAEEDATLSSVRSPESIRVILNKLGYSRKRLTKQPINRNTEYAMKKRKVWGDHFIRMVKLDVQLVFVDEAGFCRGQLSHFGFSPIGKSTTATVDQIRHQNNTVIAGMAIGHPLYAEIITGACNNERFLDFCRNLIQFLKQHLDMTRPVCVIMDNARIHTNGVFELFWSHHIYVLKTIPYSPQTNAVEKVFSQTKSIMTQILGSNYEYAVEKTKLLKDQVEREFETNYLNLVSRYDVGGDNEGNSIFGEIGTQTVDVNLERFNRELNRLQERKERSLERCNTRENEVNSTSDTIEDDLYKSMVLDSFERVSIANTMHYLAFTIKVAHSCSHGYPLLMDGSFYRDYQITDDEELLALYNQFNGAN